MLSLVGDVCLVCVCVSEMVTLVHALMQRVHANPKIFMATQFCQ